MRHAAQNSFSLHTAHTVPPLSCLKKHLHLLHRRPESAKMKETRRCILFKSESETPASLSHGIIIPPAPSQVVKTPNHSNPRRFPQRAGATVKGAKARFPGSHARVDTSGSLSGVTGPRSGVVTVCQGDRTRCGPEPSTSFCFFAGAPELGMPGPRNLFRHVCSPPLENKPARRKR